LRHKKHDCASDGPYTGSIGLDSGDGDSVGDDR